MSKKKELSVNLEAINAQVDELENVEALTVQEPTSEDMQDSIIGSLLPRHQRIIHMYLSGGYNVPQIADTLGYSRSYVRNLLAREDIKEAINKIQLQEDEIIMQGIKALRFKAMQTMNELMDSRQDAIKYQAARDILDRTGHKGVDKKQVEVNVTFEQQLKEVLGNKTIVNIKDYDIIDVDSNEE